jgi:hypothetical protein
MDEQAFVALLPKLHKMSNMERVAALKPMTLQQQHRAVAAVARAYVNDDSATTTTLKSEPRISDEQVAAIYARRQQEQVAAPPPTDSRGNPAFGTDAHVNAIYASRAQASGAEHIGTPD